MRLRPVIPRARFPRRAARCLVLASLAILIAVAVHAASAKPAEISTALPPVSLPSAQLAAIAAKGVPQTAPAKTGPPRAKLAHPTLAPPPASAYGTSAGAAAKLEHALHPVRVLPQISPALGVIPRPEWKDPFSVKQRDIAMIGGHPTPVPGTQAVRR